MRRALLVGLLVLVASPVRAGDTVLVNAARSRIELESRAVADARYPLAQQDESQPRSGVFDPEKIARVKHGAFSLLVPGWSQYRAGHTKRAIGFAASEVLIWGTFVFSNLQADYREDRYREYAELFAGVQDAGGRNDDYWRAVGRYRDVEEYNNRVRRDNRAAALEQEFNGEPVTIGLNDGVLSEADGWTWTSERRQTEFRSLRADAQSAEDRAGFVLLFALVNRVIAFADAVRSGPASADGSATLLRAHGMELGLDVDPRITDPGASLRLGTRF